MGHTNFFHWLMALGAFILLLTLVPYLGVVFLRRFDLEKMPENEGEDYLEGLKRGREWAEENEFEFVGCYILGGGRNETRIAAWRHRERPTFFYSMGSDRHLSTLFADASYLVTGTSRGASEVRLPPGAYIQVFHGKPTEELWERHLEGENYLLDDGGAELIESNEWFEEWLIGSWKEQVDSMRSVPFWPLRVFLWMLRSERMSGLSIQQQHERGWIRMPNEMEGERKV